MKRSDMIKVINDYLLDSGAIYETVHVDNISYDILNLLESEGMSPPSYTKTVSDEERHELGTNHTAYYTGKMRVHEWEPEDE